MTGLRDYKMFSYIITFTVSERVNTGGGPSKREDRFVEMEPKVVALSQGIADAYVEQIFHSGLYDNFISECILVEDAPHIISITHY